MEALPTVRIAAADGLVYLPYYLGIAQGHFARAGVNVALVRYEAGRSDITNLLLNDEADLVLGSLVYAHALSRQTDVSIVAISNQQTRHFLFRRAADVDESFDWSMLRGRTVVIEPTSVPTSWVAFIAALRRLGLSLDQVRTLVGFTPGAVLDEFIGGTGDFLLASVSAATNRRVRLVAPLADALGPAPWSVFCATRTWVERQPARVEAFLQGLRSAMRWLATASHADVLDAALACFPNEDAAIVDLTIAHYRRIGFWAADPSPRRDDLARWEYYLRDGGLLPSDSRLTELVRLGGEVLA